MKRENLLRLGCCLRWIVVGVGSMLLCSCSFNKRPAQGAAQGGATIAAQHGVVYVQRPGSDDWVAAISGLEVPVGTSIRSGLEGKVELRFGNNRSTISVGPNSFVQLEDLAGDPLFLRGDVRLQLGVWYGEVSGVVASGLDGSRVRLTGDDGNTLLSAPPPGMELEFAFKVAQPMFRFDLLPGSTPGITSTTFSFDYYTMNIAKVVPEPAVVLLLALGGGALWCARRRRPVTGR